MRFYFKTAAIATITSLLFACTSPKVNVDNVPEHLLFIQAQEALKEGNFRKSTTLLEELDKAYPYGPYSQQVQLNLIYVYYKNGDYGLSVAMIDRFIKLNPTHPNIDWVFYMRGVSNIAQDDNQFQSWLGIDRSDRDTGFSKVAFVDFTYLINNYPNSPYSYDAEKRLVFLKNRLAKYELEVVKFYTKREAYVAVVNRVKEMLKLFSDTVATRKALPYMRDAFKELGLTKEADDTQKLIDVNGGVN